ncbi:54S ribosomal protein L32 mitochondrial [Spathaspora sp. JA1]|nr:54S ribosomal protein L32 mitochondrial [Spathaspora sp. JA1]
MSLVFRFGAMAAAHESLINLLPRLPSIRITIGETSPSTTPEIDPRLEELGEHLHNNDGEPPFMIDNGILRAVPKKKMSYRRHRTKLYAPGNKQVQPLHNIVRCSACGRVKRSHFMCMYCFAEIRTFLKGLKRKNGLIEDPVNPQTDLDPTDDRILYPGKVINAHDLQLKKKDYIPKREEPLMFSRENLLHKKKKW